MAYIFTASDCFTQKQTLALSSYKSAKLVSLVENAFSGLKADPLPFARVPHSLIVI